MLTVRSSILAFAAAILASSLAFAAPARAASSCSAAVIKDWEDGRLDSSYAPDCYRAALRELPEDIRIYSSAQNDINRALIASVAKKSTKAGAVKGMVRTLASAQSASSAREQAAAAADDPSASAVPLTVLVFAGGALLLVSGASISVVARRVRRRGAS